MTDGDCLAIAEAHTLTWAMARVHRLEEALEVVLVAHHDTCPDCRASMPCSWAEPFWEALSGEAT